MKLKAECAISHCCHVDHVATASGSERCYREKSWKGREKVGDERENPVNFVNGKSAHLSGIFEHAVNGVNVNFTGTNITAVPLKSYMFVPAGI